jgi:glycosyltransferase involved in cell wall biosynthesis
VSLRPSIIIPARNAAHDLDLCLAALGSSAGGGGPHDTIVVDVGSTDATAAVARARGAHVDQLPGRGPAAGPL